MAKKGAEYTNKQTLKILGLNQYCSNLYVSAMFYVAPGVCSRCVFTTVCVFTNLCVCVHDVLCVCVFTTVCVPFGWVKCRAQILSMCLHTWPHVTSLLYVCISMFVSVFVSFTLPMCLSFILYCCVLFSASWLICRWYMQRKKTIKNIRGLHLNIQNLS